MDRKAWIAVSLSVAGLIAWYYYFGVLHKPPVRPPAPAVAAASATPLSTSTPASEPGATPVESMTALIEQNESLAGQDTQYVFSNDKGGIERVILLQHFGENKQEIFLNGDRSMPIGAVGTIAGQPWGGFEMKTD